MGSFLHRTSRRGLVVGAMALVVGCRGTRGTSAPTTEPTASAVPAPAPTDRSSTKRARELPAEPPASARLTDSGVAIVVLEPGDPDSERPRSRDRLELRYRVWDGEGRLVERTPAERTQHLSMDWLPPGWAEAMSTLHVGAHAHVWVPAQLAYAAHPDAPQGMLVIDVELVSLEVLTADDDDLPLTSPPSNALRTASGLAFVMIRAGDGVRHPSPDARVTVHYEGWTADGKSFDSSYERGRPATFPLRGVITGWQEALPLMTEGEKTRFWIPAELAYGNKPGRPQGMLIFDIELLRIEPETSG